MEQREEVVISIIGGGASSVALLDNFVSQQSQGDRSIKLKIRIFEKREESKPIGPGYAFDIEQSDTNIMNSPIDLVSLKGEENEEHFLKWLNDAKEKWCDAFPEIY